MKKKSVSRKKASPARALRSIKAVVMDVDGVLTDGRIWLGADNEWTRSFTVKDGIGIKRLIRDGYHVGWITGSRAKDIVKRAEMLGVKDLAQGNDDKVEAFEAFLNKYNLSDDEVAYIGDDTPDIPLLARCGFAVTVPEAFAEMKALSAYVTKAPGGFGAVRELCDLVSAHGHFSR